MTIGAAVVLYAVVWFMVLFIILPLRLTSQEEAGDIVPGTPSSAPVNPKLGKKAIWTTIVSTVVWVALVAIIASGILPLSTFDFYVGIPD
jgi:predicted secreted protein